MQNQQQAGPDVYFPDQSGRLFVYTLMGVSTDGVEPFSIRWATIGRHPMNILSKA